MNTRVVANLVAVTVATVALVVYTVTELLAAALFAPTYPLYVELPEAGGLIARQEVTVSGRVVGRVAEVDLHGDGVVAELAIAEGEAVPRDSRVVVLRRSPLGEQAIDFRPASDRADPYEPGDTVVAADATTPVPVQRLLALANEVLDPVDADAAGRLVAELADTVRGRRQDLRDVVSDSARLSEAVADNAADLDTFFREGATVAAALADSREALSRSIGEMADAAQLLADVRGDLEGLLVDAPPALTQVGGLVRRAQPNLACIIGDLADTNVYLARPEQLHHAGEALRLNRWFFVGFDIITERDARGGDWQRIHFLPPQESVGLPYVPHRPIPATLPGGACESAFGPGAPAATQPDVDLVHPESRLVPPEDDRSEPVRPGADRELSAARAPGQAPQAPGHGLPLLLGAVTLAGAGRLGRGRARGHHPTRLTRS